MNKSKESEKAKEEKKSEMGWIWICEQRDSLRRAGRTIYQNQDINQAQLDSNTKSKVPEKESSTMDYQ